MYASAARRDQAHPARQVRIDSHYAPLRMRIVAALFLCTALGLASCGGGSGSSGDGRVVVVGTTTQVGDLLREVAGRRADVRQILRPNSDPHEYEPRPSDVKGLTEAKLVVRSGGEVDDWLDDLVDSAGSDAPVLTLIDGVRTRRAGDDVDPHWWQDPRNAELAVAAIRDRLAEVDPGGRRRLQAERGALPGAAAPPRRPDGGVHPAHPGRRTQARDHPRRSRLLRRPLRARGHRRGAALPVHAGPALGAGHPGAGGPDRERRGEGDLPGELHQPGAGARRGA